MNYQWLSFIKANSNLSVNFSLTFKWLNFLNLAQIFSDLLKALIGWLFLTYNGLAQP